ncbi:30S ribosome-binding factor RbfA [Flavobacteriaceae bacterium]|nr:30S ribosome-binding factor RbfA [Flavobacteriaceae bacterium]
MPKRKGSLFNAYFCGMESNETPRQKKINTVLQQEIAILLQLALREQHVKNLMISVTKVRITPDLANAKVYLSIFPTQGAVEIFENLKQNAFQIRHDLSQKMKNQLRRMPELLFFLDDSLTYVEAIEKELKKGSDPIKENALEKRQKK